MADKSQNITINYKFNTAELDRANAILNRANQASNNLQQSGQKAGQGISQGFNQARKSIASMEIELARLKTIIQTSSDPKRVAELSKEYKILKTQIDAANKAAFETPKALKNTQQSAQSLTQTFGGLYTAVKLFLTAGIVKEVFDLTLGMATLSGNVEGVERAFQRQVPNSVSLLDDLTRATNGAVGELDLMQKTLQAKNLGIPVQNLATFFEFAAVRAQQTGVSVDYLTESIVNGLGRKSTRVLDNLGISATRIKDEFHGVSLEQLSVAEVSQGVANIIGEEMGKMGGYVETAATKVEQLGVSFQKLKEEASKAFSGEGGLIDFMKQYTDSFGLAFEAVNKGISVEELANQKRIEAIALISEREYAQRVLNGTEEENIKSIEDEIAALTKELGTWAKMRKAAQERIDSLNEEKIALGEKLDTQKISREEAYREFRNIEELLVVEAKRRDARKEDISIDQEILKLLQGRLAAIKQIDDAETKSTGIIERQKAEIERIQQLIETTNNASDLSSIDGGVVKVGKLIKELELAQAVLADYQHAFNDIDIKPFEIKVKDATKAISNFVGTVNDAQGLGPLFSDEWLKEPDESILEGTIRRIQQSLNRLAEANPVTFPGVTVAQPEPSFWSELGQTFTDNWRDIVSDAVDIQANFINDVLNVELDNMKNQISVLRAYYDEQELLAGDNERKKKELRLKEEREIAQIQKRLFEKEKSTRRAQAVIDGAAGVIKAFATAPNIYVAIIQAALVAAETIAQIRVINKATSGYAKGVIDLKGPGTGTSDSIPANLSRGESVMTAWETRHAGDVLKDIRAKKLDNKVLKELRQGRTPIQHSDFKDKGIIDAIKSIPQVDVIEQSGIVYRVEKMTDTYFRKIRAKSTRL